MDILELLDDLEEMFQDRAAKQRREGYAAQMQGLQVIAATHIGREFAFMQVVAELREIRARLRGANQLVPFEVTDPRD